MFTIKATGIKDGIKGTLTWTEMERIPKVEFTEPPLSEKTQKEWDLAIAELTVERITGNKEWFPIKVGWDDPLCAYFVMHRFFDDLQDYQEIDGKVEIEEVVPGNVY